jgi:O-6-methylguanine DNA methyltransferase
MTRTTSERPFERRILSLVARIPAGRVATYGDLAAHAGRPAAARAVGRILAAATRPGLPYHRVIGAGGAIGGYGSGSAMKAALLAAEGHTVRRGRVLDFARHRWHGPRKVTRPM